VNSPFDKESHVKLALDRITPNVPDVATSLLAK
jgi:hypothetical protein